MDQRVRRGLASRCASTFDHMIGNIEVWTDLMMERPVRMRRTRDFDP